MVTITSRNIPAQGSTVSSDARTGAKTRKFSSTGTTTIVASPAREIPTITNVSA